MKKEGRIIMSGKKANTDPSFFKVLIAQDFKKLLRIPPAFSTKHGVNPGEKIKLRSHSGRETWKVKVERVGINGPLCFTKGCENFVQDAALQLGEFVFFTRVAPSEFHVAIYTTNFCLRPIPPPSPSLPNFNLHASKEKNRKHPEPENDAVCSRGPLYLEFRLKDYHKSRLNLPKVFVVGGKLQEKSEVRLEYVGKESSGERERTVVVLDHRPQNKRSDLAKGWPKFRTQNRMVCGELYSFQFKPRQNNDVILVKQVQE